MLFRSLRLNLMDRGLTHVPSTVGASNGVNGHGRMVMEELDMLMKPISIVERGVTMLMSVLI